MRTCRAPCGRLAPLTLPASGFNSVASAGMLITDQCHQPEPVGASGSYTVTAKLLVSLGAPLHFKAGDLFSPEQPKLLNSNFLSIVPLALMSGLLRVKPAACTRVAVPNRAVAIRVFFMRFSLWNRKPNDALAVDCGSSPQ